MKNCFISIWDIPAAFSILSRLPVPGDHQKFANRSPHAIWAYPLVGAVIGGLAGVLILVLTQFPLPSGLIAGGALAALVMMTGAMHEDGLADCADGFWGGAAVKRRLEIMKDSRIGAYGVIALALILLVEWSLIEGLLYAEPVFLFAAIGAVSRAPLGFGMALLPNARGSGLSSTVGAPSFLIALLGLLVSFGLSGALIGWTACAISLFASFIGAGIVYLVAWLKIGGQTGDVLGAAQKLAALFALSSLYLF